MLDAGRGHLAARCRFLCWVGRLEGGIDDFDGCGNGLTTLSDGGWTFAVLVAFVGTWATAAP